MYTSSKIYGDVSIWSVWRRGKTTYHAGAAADLEGLGICLCVVLEGSMEGGLVGLASCFLGGIERFELTGRTKLMTLKLRRQALI
jgi:hypothetical protein